MKTFNMIEIAVEVAHQLPDNESHSDVPVSYTHLTLPTILRV